MVWVNWDIFTTKWLGRSERGKQSYIDGGDRFLALWISFNGWLRHKFGESERDIRLLTKVKNLSDFKTIYENMKRSNPQFLDDLNKLEIHTVFDMRYPNKVSESKKYDGTFESLIDVLYKIRCNLFHGRKDVDEDNKDIELVSLAYAILLPLFKKYLHDCEGLSL